MKWEHFYNYAGIIFSVLFALFGFILFYSGSGLFWNSLLAAGMVFLLTWLTCVVVKWIFEMF